MGFRSPDAGKISTTGLEFLSSLSGQFTFLRDIVEVLEDSIEESGVVLETVFTRVSFGRPRLREPCLSSLICDSFGGVGGFGVGRDIGSFRECDACGTMAAGTKALAEEPILHRDSRVCRIPIA